MPLVAARCARCGFPAPVEDEEVTGETDSDPDDDIVTVPPPGWIGDPDSDGIIHRRCADPEENEQHDADLRAIERVALLEKMRELDDDQDDDGV